MLVTDVKTRGAGIRYGRAGSRVGMDWVSLALQLAVKGIWKGATQHRTVCLRSTCSITT